MKVTQERLKEVLSYDPDTGIFTWLVDSRNGCKAGDIAGCTEGHGYIAIGVNRIIYKAHRIAFLYMTGAFPKDHVDHINGIKDDNRWLNLRDVTPADNQKNAKKRIDNTSGVTGVYWDKKRNKLKVQIRAGGEQLHLGSFDDFFEACCIRKSAEVRYGYHENHGRHN